MFSFENDYSEGACPEILNALAKTNYVQVPGYGLDQFCETARTMIKKAVGNDDVDVHFIPGGTPCNTLAAALLKPYEAIISADTGHINTHETGSVESTGHKIIAIEHDDGKITAKQIKETIAKFTDEHVVKPKMVFISNPSEFGSIYTKNELVEMSNVCKENDLYLYLDGARLGSALTSKANNLTLQDICDLTDLFYIGGTKNGALYGEAMVIKKPELKPGFRHLMKQKLSMMAKSRVMGVEFMTLFSNNLYYKLAKQANDCANTLRQVFEYFGIKQYIDSPTNQLFVVINNDLLKAIKQNYIVTEWAPYDEYNTIVRFVCSWNTKVEDIKNFFMYMKKVTGK